MSIEAELTVNHFRLAFHIVQLNVLHETCVHVPPYLAQWWVLIVNLKAEFHYSPAMRNCEFNLGEISLQKLQQPCGTSWSLKPAAIHEFAGSFFFHYHLLWLVQSAFAVKSVDVTLISCRQRSLKRISNDAKTRSSFFHWKFDLLRFDSATSKWKLLARKRQFLIHKKAFLELRSNSERNLITNFNALSFNFGHGNDCMKWKCFDSLSFKNFHCRKAHPSKRK